jgi:hypothetical protein
MKLTGQRNQCRGCDQYFNSNVAFAKHRTGKFEEGRRCRTAEEMIAKGMSLNAAGFWITAAMPTDKVNTLKGIDDDAQEN